MRADAVLATRNPAAKSKSVDEMAIPNPLAQKIG